MADNDFLNFLPLFPEEDEGTILTRMMTWAKNCFFAGWMIVVLLNHPVCPNVKKRFVLPGASVVKNRKNIHDR